MYGLNNSGEGAVLALTRHFLICIWRSAYLKVPVSNFKRQRHLTISSRVSYLLTAAIA